MTTPGRENEKRQGRRDGERRKRRTLTALEARRELFVLRGRRALLAMLLDVGSATADDVRDAVTLPADIKPTLFGSVPGMLAFAGIIRADGFAKTCRPIAHARDGLKVWKLVNRERAEQWLIDHPDRPDDPQIAIALARSPEPTIAPTSGATTQRTLFQNGEN